MARISFESSTFNGTESSGVISATVVISGGIVSSRDISVPIVLNGVTATGYHRCFIVKFGVEFNYLINSYVQEIQLLSHRIGL